MADTPEISFSYSLFPGQTFQACFKPSPYASLYARVQRTPEKRYIPVINGRFTFPYLNLRVQCQTNDLKRISSTDCQISVGTNRRGFCFQYFNRLAGPNGFSAMVYRTAAGGTTSFAVAGDPHWVWFLTHQREIRNWKVGVKFQCTDRLTTWVGIGWIARIGRYTIHSTVRSSGEVKSHFRAEMTPEADLVVTADLNHIEHRYRFGMGLEWETGIPRPQTGLWNQLRRSLRGFLGSGEKEAQ
jgi:hypothetical protein